jgi:hypothetical protein
MTYNKPEVVKLDSALSSIQGTEKGPPIRLTACRMARHPVRTNQTNS